MPSLVQLAQSKSTKEPFADKIKLLLAMLSPVQRRFVEDKSRRKLARCGRRSGKSFMDAVYMIIVCLQTGRSPVLYAGLTRDSAKEIIWPILIAILEELEIPHTPKESALMVRFPNGSKITIFGCDATNARNRLRGRKFKLVIFDETAFYASLDPLIYALLPMLADYGGTLCLTSSPGELLSGLFYEADQGPKKTHWSHYEWTIHDNPHFQKPALDSKYKTRAEEEIAIVLETEFNGDANRPEFRREWLGIWVQDKTTFVYPIGADNNVPVAYKMPHQMHAFGIELSAPFTHTLVVARYSTYSRDFQIVRVMTVNDLDLNQFMDVIKQDVANYDPVVIAAYIGKFSDDITDELKRRYQLPIIPVTNKDKVFYQKVFATDLAAGHIKFVDKETAPLTEEYSKLVKDKDGKEIDGQPNSLANAALAVHRKVYQTHLSNFKIPKSEEERMIEQLEHKRYEEPEYFDGRIEREYYDTQSDFGQEI